MNFETKQQMINRINNEKNIELKKNLLIKKRTIKKPIIKKTKEIDQLTKKQREYILKIKSNNKIKDNIKNMIQPEFLNISSINPDNLVLIKDNIEDIYNDGDLINKNLILEEFKKIDDEFKKNLLTIMTLKDYDRIINSELGKNKSFKRFININFKNFIEKLKDKYRQLDVQELIFFMEEFYKNPKFLTIKDSIEKRFQDFYIKTEEIKNKIKNKILKHNTDLEKKKEYSMLESKIENIQEKINTNKTIINTKPENIEEIKEVLEEEKKNMENIDDSISVTNTELIEIEEDRKLDIDMKLAKFYEDVNNLDIEKFKKKDYGLGEKQTNFQRTILIKIDKLRNENINEDKIYIIIEDYIENIIKNNPTFKVISSKSDKPKFFTVVRDLIVFLFEKKLNDEKKIKIN